jgi:transposase-like protein
LSTLKAVQAFGADYGAKWPKAVAKITENVDTLLAFCDYSAEHWIHLRTTNPIESTFATVRLRQRVTKGPGSRAAAGRDGLQTHRVRASQVASRERAAPGRARPRRRQIREQQADRTTPATNPTTSQEVTPTPHGTPIHRS